MTDKEMVMHLLKTLEREIYCEKSDYLEVENTSYGESIVFKFDEKGKIVDLYS